MSEYILVTRAGKSKSTFLARRRPGTKPVYNTIAEFYDPISAEKALNEVNTDPVLDTLVAEPKQGPQLVHAKGG